MVTTTSRLGLSKYDASDSMQSMRTGRNANMAILDDALLTNAATTFSVGYGNRAISTNHCVGTSALAAITTGYANTALGYQTLMAATEGIGNTALGYQALKAVTTGDFNIAIGRTSAILITTGDRNVAVGVSALAALTTASDNTAVGTYAGQAATTAANLTLIGRSAGAAITTGSNNTCLGHSAGIAITTGSNLTVLGYTAAASAVDATNEVTLGNVNVTTLRCATTTITAISDVRDKTNIETLPLGLDFLKDLKPVRWNWQKRIQTEDGQLVDNPEVGAQDLGFVAQDLDAAQEKHSAAWLGLVLKATPDRWEATPGKLLPVMVRAIQELAAENESLKARISALEA